MISELRTYIPLGCLFCKTEDQDLIIDDAKTPCKCDSIFPKFQELLRITDFLESYCHVLIQEALNEAAMSSSSNKKGQSSLAVAVADCRVLVKTLGL